MIPHHSPRVMALITTFGLGKLRPFPGTWGSLPPVALAAILLAAGAAPTEAGWSAPAFAAYHAALATVLVVFSWACLMGADEAEARFLKKDPSEVVADETAGMCIPLMFLPAATLSSPGLIAFTLVFAFIAFRVLDITKPWPAWSVQRVPGGWGVLLDDLVAGVFAAAIVQATARLVMG